MQINVTIDNSELLARFGPKRLAFAVVNALNNTAKAVQRAEREEVKRDFTVRKTEFIEREAAIIKPFANVRQGRLFVDISIGQKPRLLLSQFTRGGRRKPFKGKRVAVPVIGGARPSKAASVPEALYVQALRLRRAKASTRATRKRRRAGLVGKTWVGERGSYLIPSVGIFQRSPGEERGRALYLFAENVQIDRRYDFERRARETTALVFPREMAKEVADVFARRGLR